MITRNRAQERGTGSFPRRQLRGWIVIGRAEPSQAGLSRAEPSRPKPGPPPCSPRPPWPEPRVRAPTAAAAGAPVPGEGAEGRGGEGRRAGHTGSLPAPEPAERRRQGADLCPLRWLSASS